MGRPLSLAAPATDLVLKVLRKYKEPMTAYTLLEKLKNNGIRSAPIIYRALDVLIKEGSVHKIKELGAFVACDCAKDHKHALSVLTVCSCCRRVVELHDYKIISQIENLREYGILLSEDAVIELPITCKSCVS